MARKFILIDQSVKKPGGHHYEYAKRALDAARAHGFSTLLLAHKDYQGTVDHHVKPAFSLTFWENYAHYYGMGPPPNNIYLFAFIMRVRRFFATWWLNTKRKLIYSSTGLAWARARHIFLKDILLKPALPEDLSTYPSSRLTLALARIFIVSAPSLQSMIERARRLLPLSLLRRLCLIFLSPLLIMGAGILLLRTRRTDPGARFASEFMQLVGQDLSEDDVIFVPNATAAELEGFVHLWRASRLAARAHWAFLYRRPVFSGYPEGYKNQMEAVRRYRVEFARLKEAAPNAHIAFYTDTDELTAQYNMLGAYLFKTVPVPVDLVDVAPQKLVEPIVIGYLGDARDEKGFQLLPRIVEACKPTNSAHTGVRFLFQANFNVPDGEPGSRYARSLLEQYGEDIVELVYGPFDSQEYAALARQMDIVLIPYSPGNYSARSSGVIMEAISAGVPVLVPAGSWMARLGEPARRRHYHMLFATHEPLARVAAAHELINNKILKIDALATHISIRIKYETSFNGFISVTITSINDFEIPLETRRMIFNVIDGEAIAIFDKPSSSKLCLKAEPVEPQTRVQIIETEIGLYKLDEAIPLDAGIAIYDGDDDIVRASRSLINFYSHHKIAAEALRDDLRSLYDPAVLISMLDPQVPKIFVGAVEESALA